MAQTSIDIFLPDPQATHMLGFALARELPIDAAVLLHGELGSGKTALAKGVAAGLGVDPRTVTSPTFIICSEHEVPAGEANQAAARRLVHADLYRCTSARELDALAWDQIVADEQATLVVEWPQRVGGLPTGTRPVVEVSLEHGPEGGRWARVRVMCTSPTLDAVRASAMLQRIASTIDAASPAPRFGSAREQLADLHRWLSGQYTISRDLNNDDLAQDSAPGPGGP